MANLKLFEFRSQDPYKNPTSAFYFQDIAKAFLLQEDLMWGVPHLHVPTTPPPQIPMVPTVKPTPFLKHYF